MPYNPNFTPDAPLPISMLPDAEPLTLDDLLLLTQPSNAQCNMGGWGTSDLGNLYVPIRVCANA